MFWLILSLISWIVARVKWIARNTVSLRNFRAIAYFPQAIHLSA
jgi:hypothetical protein